jgi:hypothetical protein
MIDMRSSFSSTTIVTLVLILCTFSLLISADFSARNPGAVDRPSSTANVAAANVAAKMPPAENEKLSPYQIAGSIDHDPKGSLQDLWGRLKIKQNFIKDWNAKDTEMFMNECSHCEAETFGYDLDETPGREIILRVTDNLQERCRYLIFKERGNDSWTFIGNVDHDFGRYEMPQHSFVLDKGKSLFIVRVQTQSGSGVALYTNRVFAIRNDKLIELLDFVSDGHQSGVVRNYDSTFSGKLVDYEVKNQIARLTVEFNVTISASDETTKISFDPIHKKHRAVYVRAFNAGTTKLDPGSSNITQREINAIYNVDSLTEEDFPKYFRKELNAIRAQKHTRAARWYKENYGPSH